MQRNTGSKEGLRLSIIAKRQAKGDDVKEHRDTTMTELTPHERARKERRKEQNRRAAQRCRFKKRQNQSKVLQTFQNILDSNRDLRGEMQILKVERDNLQTAWSAHCRSCPLLLHSSVKKELPCSIHHSLIETDEPSSMLDIVAGIKQEAPPLSDCMATPSNQHSATIDSVATFHSCAEDYYPYHEHYYTPTPPPQYNQHHHFHLHHHHQQQKIKATSTITPNRPFSQMYPYSALPAHPNHFLESTSTPNNRSLCTPTPVSLIPKLPVPYTNQNEPDQHNQSVQPTLYGYAKNAKESCQSKPGTCNASNDSKSSAMSLHTPSAVTKVFPNTRTNLVSKYPDLCRHLQSIPTHANNTNVPFGNRCIPQSPPNSIRDNASVISPRQPPYVRSSNHTPDSQPKIPLIQSLHSEGEESPGMSGKLAMKITPSCPRDYALAAIRTGTTPPRMPNSLQTSMPGNYSINNSSDSGSATSTSKSVHTNSIACTPTNEVMTSNSMSTSILDPVGNFSDMETESVLSTALDMERAYPLSSDECPGYDATSEEAIKRDNNILTRDDQLCNTDDKTTTYPVCFLDGHTSSNFITSDKCRPAVVQERSESTTQPSMADDLSGIPSKELIFFPGEMSECVDYDSLTNS